MYVKSAQMRFHCCLTVVLNYKVNVFHFFLSTDTCTDGSQVCCTHQHTASHHEAHRGASVLLTASGTDITDHSWDYLWQDRFCYVCMCMYMYVGADESSWWAVEATGGAGEEGCRIGSTGERNAVAQCFRFKSEIQPNIPADMSA